jgi:putative transposase
MPRTRRTIVEGQPHHITQRGNYRQKIFETDKDRKQYLEWIEKYSQKYKVKILAYCLMSNHVHFVVIPVESDSLSKLFNTAHMRYSHYYNKKKKAKGHLWQGRFYSCILGDEHLKTTARYVERNPVRAKIVKKAEQWAWSSAKANMDEGVGEISITGMRGYFDISGKDWKDYIKEKDAVGFIDEIRKATNMSRAMGTEAFIGKLEKKLGVSLRLISQGRPFKEKN